MAPLVSVIIPVYNAENFLRETLESMIGQTYQNIEILCVDDGSTDSSPAILEEYKKKDGRIRVFRKDGNSKFSGSFNHIMRVICLIDAYT